MERRADLSPPLGKPGGPCQVVRRINDRVRNPALKRQLVDEVSEGEDLSNSDAAKVYPLEVEGGVGSLKQIRITSHGQYRMDLRGITVDDVRKTIGGFLAQLETWRKLGSPAYATMNGRLTGGEKVEWVDPRTRLKVVFAQNEPGVATVVSTFWKGVTDPPAPGDSCKMASRVAARYLSRRLG